MLSGPAPWSDAARSGPRMALLINDPQAFGGHMGVDLSRGKALMAEKLLHHSQVGPTVQQVGCKGVPQGVGRSTPRHLVLLVAIEQGAYAAGAQATPPGVEQQRARRGGNLGARQKRGPASHEVGAEGRHRRIAQGNPSLFSSLAGDPDEPAVEVEIVEVEAAQLGHSHARAVQHLERGPITEPRRVVAGW